MRSVYILTVFEIKLYERNAYDKYDLGDHKQIHFDRMQLNAISNQIYNLFREIIIIFDIACE